MPKKIAAASKVTTAKKITEDAPTPKSKTITSSSTAEYFSKNLQQVGFSSPIKAVLTTLKEAVDNALDACEDSKILPEIYVRVEKIGEGHVKNTDRIRVIVEDNGPGLSVNDVPKVFGEYLASSKFGRGRCSRGQQGIGISAATTWAMQTTAQGVRVTTIKKGAQKALKCVVDVDLKNNRGVIKDQKFISWDREHGTSVEFILEGRMQLQGEAGLLSYLRGTILLNPHMTLRYQFGTDDEMIVERVSTEIPVIPEATAPHPHTMKLGDFKGHSQLFSKSKVGLWLKESFSRINESVLKNLVTEHKIPASLFAKNISQLSNTDFEGLYAALNRATLQAPSTQSVFALGEDTLAMSLNRLGDLNFFSVVSRKPTIVDFKPVQIEVAIARLTHLGDAESDDSIQVLRFANRVPLQFDKASCAIVKAITSVNWRTYGLKQPKNGLPQGPFILAVSVVSPFIKFKNASKETVDASDELVEELRKGLIAAGQRLSRFLNREQRAGDLEKKIRHVEQFGPVLVETLARILNAPAKRKEKAISGLEKILARDTGDVRENLKQADDSLNAFLKSRREKMSQFFATLDDDEKEKHEEIPKSEPEFSPKKTPPQTKNELSQTKNELSQTKKSRRTP